MTSLGFHATEIEPLVGGVPRRFEVLVTEGLKHFGQDELVFSFPAGEVDLGEVAERLHGALAAMGRHAQAGADAAPYGFTAFGPNSPPLIPGTEFRGLLYLPGAIPGLSWSSGYLPALALPAADAVLAQNTGFLRVSARLGQAETYYPFPFWTDPRRLPVARDGDEDSMLGRVPRLPLRDFNTTKTPRGFRMVVSRAARGRLKEIFRARNLSQAPVALLSTIHPRWECMMVWEPGQAELNAICDGPHPPDSEVGLHFALLIPGAPESTARLIEDGVGLALTRADWEELVSALTARKGRLKLDDDTHIEIARR